MENRFKTLKGQIKAYDTKTIRSSTKFLVVLELPFIAHILPIWNAIAGGAGFSWKG